MTCTPRTPLRIASSASCDPPGGDLRTAKRDMLCPAVSKWSPAVPKWAMHSHAICGQTPAVDETMSLLSPAWQSWGPRDLWKTWVPHCKSSCGNILDRNKWKKRWVWGHAYMNDHECGSMGWSRILISLKNSTGTESFDSVCFQRQVYAYVDLGHSNHVQQATEVLALILKNFSHKNTVLVDLPTSLISRVSKGFQQVRVPSKTPLTTTIKNYQPPL